MTTTFRGRAAQRSGFPRAAALAAAATVLSIGGCAGNHRFTESRIVQARQADGEIAYYRVTLEGAAAQSQSKYRAGLYDAKAVDDLFGQVSILNTDQQAVDQILEQRRRDAVSAIASEYYAELKKADADDTKLKKLEAGLARAMLDPYTAASRTTDDPVMRPRQKFVIIHSALASVVEEAIAQFAESEETKRLIENTFASYRREQFIMAKVESEGLEAARAHLIQIADAMDAALNRRNDNLINDEQYKAAVLSLVQEAASVSME